MPSARGVGDAMTDGASIASATSWANPLLENDATATSIRLVITARFAIDTPE
jgi:hypothetical protein